jgi:hypothetical protein
MNGYYISFKPTIDPIRVVMKNNLQKATGSLKKKMPINTMPTAPIPVQTAYAVPNGKVSVALYSKNTLNTRQIANPVNHHQKACPEEVLILPMQVAKPISKRLAAKRMTQFIDSDYG